MPSGHMFSGSAASKYNDTWLSLCSRKKKQKELVISQFSL